MTLPTFSLPNGHLSTSANATINFGSANLHVNAAGTNANLVGTGNIVKTGTGILDIASVSTYAGAVIVQSGNLLFDYNSRKFPTAGVTVASRNATIGAGLTQGSAWTFSENLLLQNATGLNFGGALQGYTFTGSVDLGTVGSSIANTTLAGTVTGAAVTIVGNSIFSGGNKLYTGDTIVGQSGVGVSLYLAPHISLGLTSSIIINRESLVGEEYWNSTDSQDRISDAIPISLRGGSLYAILDGPTITRQENVGPVTLQRRFSSVSVSTQYPSDFMTYSLASLARQPCATFITYGADPANADGHVDLNDLNTVLNHLGQSTPNWTDGNFDYAPTIDLNDLNAVLNNLGTSYANHASVTYAESLTEAVTPTPEPASLITLTFLAPALLRRRRH